MMILSVKKEFKKEKKSVDNVPYTLGRGRGQILFPHFFFTLNPSLKDLSPGSVVVVSQVPSLRVRQDVRVSNPP